jgi:hypothetical protein
MEHYDGYDTQKEWDNTDDQNSNLQNTSYLQWIRPKTWCLEAICKTLKRKNFMEVD